MQHRSLLTLVAVFLAVAVPTAGYSPGAAAADADLVARGKYLTTAGDCIACHTIPGGKPFSGNRAMETPFGTIYTPNLTPDKATGIGNWTDDQFYRAVHDGIGHNGEYLYPVFPFPWYTKVTRDDVMAIKAYLFSLEPVEQKRQRLEFKFPFNIRTALLGWRTAFFKAGTFAPDPHKSEEVNRGAYLVEGLGHCGECHNQHNVLGASDWSGKLKGGEIQGWYAPNITANGGQGVGSWSNDQIVTFLKSGSAPGKGVVLGPMHETIQDSLQYLSDPDLKAIAAYLKSFSQPDTYKPTDANQAVQAAAVGADDYLSNCSSCHRPDGKGIEGVIPSLVDNGSVKAKGPNNVIKVVLGGLPALNGYAPMPAAGANVPDQEIADLVNYVRTAWGNGAPANAEPGMVAKLRATSMTLMSSTVASGCVPPAGDTPVAKIDKAALQAELKGVRQQDMLQHIVVLLPKVQASAPDAKDDAIINAMTDAYCPVALADDSVPPPERTALIGSFASLVYSQIHHYENGLAAIIKTDAKQP